MIEFSGADLPKQYVGLIFAKWLRSFRYGCDYFKEMDPRSYYEHYKNYITALLPGSRIRLAVLTDDSDVVLGFSVSRGTTLDYVHVLRMRLGGEFVDYRGKGIASRLIPNEIDAFTHLTKSFIPIWKNKDKKYKTWKFNPFA